MKRCTKCEEIKPLTAFHKHPQGRDGLDPRCADCKNAAARARRGSPRPEKPEVPSGMKYCTLCHITKPADAFGRCAGQPDGLAPVCRACRSIIHRRHREKDPEKYRRKARESDERNRETNRDRATKRRRLLRLELLTHYSIGLPQCACCGEAEIAFLAIDHVDGGGAAHRKTVGSGHGFYTWLKKNGYPPGFQVLCHNCNTAKGLYGACPHQSRVVPTPEVV